MQPNGGWRRQTMRTFHAKQHVCLFFIHVIQDLGKWKPTNSERANEMKFRGSGGSREGTENRRFGLVMMEWRRRVTQTPRLDWTCLKWSAQIKRGTVRKRALPSRPWQSTRWLTARHRFTVACGIEGFKSRWGKCLHPSSQGFNYEDNFQKFFFFSFSLLYESLRKPWVLRPTFNSVYPTALFLLTSTWLPLLSSPRLVVLSLDFSPHKPPPQPLAAHLPSPLSSHLFPFIFPLLPCPRLLPFALALTGSFTNVVSFYVLTSFHSFISFLCCFLF